MIRLKKKILSKISTGKSKYNNVKTFYEGNEFASTKEANYCRQLDMQMNAKVEKDRVVNYLWQLTYKFNHNGIKLNGYILDFKVFYADGRVEFIDVKGFRTAMYNLKKKMMKAFYNIDIKEA